MKLKIATDIHYLSSHAKDISIHELQQCEFLLGDIVDRKGCKKKDIVKATELYKKLRTIWGAKYITGNHELQFSNEFYVHKNVLLMHGDFIFWDREEANQWRSQKPGSGFWRRVGGYLYNLVRDRYGRAVTDEVLKRAYDYTKAYDCDMLIVGHAHAPELQIYHMWEKKLIVLPRGISEVEL